MIIINSLKGEVSNGKSQNAEAIDLQKMWSLVESQSQRSKSMSEMSHSILGYTFYQREAKKKGGEK